MCLALLCVCVCLALLWYCLNCLCIVVFGCFGIWLDCIWLEFAGFGLILLRLSVFVVLVRFVVLVVLFLFVVFV